MSTKTLTPSQKTKNFLAKKPTYICTVAGIRFYEHPTMGDEAPLVMIKNGEVSDSEFWEAPHLYEVIELYGEF